MTKPELVVILQPLVSVMRADFDATTWSGYFRALEDVPVNLLRLAVDQAVKGPSPYMPKPGELRTMAEAQRLALSASVKFEGCAMCQASGWVTVVDPGGARRVQRCACWKAHLQRLTTLGVSTPLALPAGDFSQVADQ